MINSNAHLRLATSVDLASILKIEAVNPSTNWSNHSFETYILANNVWVLDQDATVVGFIVQQTVAREATILAIRIADEFQRQGLGQALLDAWLMQLPLSIDMVFLEVRKSNTSAIRLYTQYGFKPMGERKGYYPGVANLAREDALMFTLQISRESPDAHVKPLKE